jgi:hypothetical protein
LEINNGLGESLCNSFVTSFAEVLTVRSWESWLTEPCMMSPEPVFALLGPASILSNFKLGEFLVGLSTEGSLLMSMSSCFTGLLLSRDESEEHAEEEEDAFDDSTERQLLSVILLLKVLSCICI